MDVHFNPFRSTHDVTLLKVLALLDKIRLEFGKASERNAARQLSKVKTLLFLSIIRQFFYRQRTKFGVCSIRHTYIETVFGMITTTPFHGNLTNEMPFVSRTLTKQLYVSASMYNRRHIGMFRILPSQIL
jgi:hypothetical protein